MTFFRYAGFRNKLWAFGMMQFAHKDLANVNGQTFYRLMGSGKGLGFNPWPDWSVYALIQSWDCEEDALDFFDHDELMARYDERSNERCTVFMTSTKAHGTWSGQSPFVKPEDAQIESVYTAVLTRAVIRTSKLITFWSYVPTAQRPIEGAKGLLFTKGVGEVPFKNMATFSIWESEQDMMTYAYKSPEHQKAIHMTRELNWYSEEMFSRFSPYAIEGDWGGAPLVPSLDRKR
jgi:heme-degrading monooxygenase HmoA